MDSALAQPVVALVAVVLVLWPCVAIIRRCILSPLSNVPGPRFAAASSLWLWWRDVAGTSPAAIKSLHKRYGTVAQGDAPRWFDSILTRIHFTGPLVRISPNELSIDDTDAHNNALYSHANNFTKVSSKNPNLATRPTHAKGTGTLFLRHVFINLFPKQFHYRQSTGACNTPQVGE